MSNKEELIKEKIKEDFYTDLKFAEKIHNFREFIFYNEISFKGIKGSYINFQELINKFDETFNNNYFDLIPKTKYK